MMTPLHRGIAIGLAAAALSGAAAAQPHCQPYWQYANSTNVYVGQSMVTFDDGSGPAVYAKFGLFTTDPLYRLRQSGAWERVDAGIPPGASYVAGYILDDGTGAALCALGATHDPVLGWDRWMRCWDGAQWNLVWPDMYWCDNPFSSARCKFPSVSVDVGTGMAIYGTHRRGDEDYGILRWDGSQWVEFSSANHHPKLRVLDLGEGPGLYAMGFFTSIGGIEASGFARWTGDTWINLNAPGYRVLEGTRATVVYDDGTGPAIYTLNGAQYNAQPLGAVKRWRKGIWETVGSAVLPPNTVTAYFDLHVFDDGSGPALYVIGGFSNINGVPANQIARYDSSGWSAIGSGFFRPNRMASIDMDVGPSLIIAQHGNPAFIGQYVGCPSCYANCDGSSGKAALNVDDFTCFIDQFAHATTLPVTHQPYHYANCDGNIDPPVLTVDDFMCFINRFAQGCQ